MPTSGSLTTDLRYDVGGECEQEGDRLVMVAGTVTDRFGATAELCDRESKCPFVVFSFKTDILIEADEFVDQIDQRFKDNQITGMEAVDDLIFAVQAGQAQARKVGVMSGRVGIIIE